MIEEFTTVALTTDLSDYHLKAGDTGTVVDVIGNGSGYVIEFITILGKTVAVTKVAPSQIRRIERGEIANARPLAQNR